jgi:hypothetical protein
MLKLYHNTYHIDKKIVKWYYISKKEVVMRVHPQKSTEEILNKRARRVAISVKQRVADATKVVKTNLPSDVWSIKLPKVLNEGTELAHGVFEHAMFVSGSKDEVRKVAEAITGLPEEAEERPNWKVTHDGGKEYVINAKKFLANAR